MKKLIPVVLAISIGSLCAYFLFKKVEADTINPDIGNVIAIQIGVFTKKENAEVMMKNYGGMVFDDDGIYRVYYSILSKNDNVDYIKNYLDEKGINYYLRKITLDKKAVDSALDYELLMEKTNDESKIQINKELLEHYEEVI